MTLEQALEYVRDEWAVLPLKVDKTPYLPAGEHKKYLYQAATEDEVRAFWKRYPNANVGLACGKVSGRTVIDIDKGVDVFPDTKTVQTPAGGKHKIYQYSEAIQNSVSSYYKGIDTRNDGGYIVAAGSHCVYTKEGKRIDGVYKLIDELPSRPFPVALFQKKIGPEGGKFDPKKLLGAPDGERNATAASVIGLLVQGKSKDIQVPLWELTKAWNNNNHPPLDEGELLSVFNSITQREWSKEKDNIKLIDGLKVIKEGRDYIVEVPLSEGKVFITFSEIQRSRQSFETVLNVQLVHNKDGKLPAFERRIDMNSASAVDTLTTALNKAYGSGKEYNWTLVMNRAAVAMKKLYRDEKKATVFKADERYEQSTYLVEHFLEEGSPTLIHGDGSTGKSYLTLYLAVCAALGRPFFNKRTEYFKTLYIDHEATARKLRNRMHRVANGIGVSFESLVPHIHWYKPEGSLANEQEIIARMVEEGGYKCIIVDAGASASGGSPMDEQAVLKMFNSLDQIPCAKLIIHHEPKNVEGVGDDKSYYGTTFWRNAPRLAWRLKREAKEGNKSTIKAIHHKANDDGESLPFFYAMEFTEDVAPRTTFNVVDEFTESDETKIVNLVVEIGEASLAQIVDATGLSKTGIHRALHTLMGDGRLVRVQDGKHRQKFVYKLADREYA
jgi:predicted transcriptional regulator